MVSVLLEGKLTSCQVYFFLFSPCTKVLKALVNAVSVTSYDGVCVFSSLTDKSISTKQYHS